MKSPKVGQRIRILSRRTSSIPSIRLPGGDGVLVRISEDWTGRVFHVKMDGQDRETRVSEKRARYVILGEE